MYTPTSLERRQISTNTDDNRTIAWVATIIIVAVVIIGVWSAFKIWGSRARNARAEQELGVSALPPARPRFRRTKSPRGDVLPVYDPNGRPPAFSPPGMPPPAYLPTDGMRQSLRRTPSLGSIEEKDEEVDEKKEMPRRGSV